MRRLILTSRFLLIAVFSLFASLISSCGDDRKVVYSDFYDIPADGWKRLAILSFSPMPFDSVTDMNDHIVEITIRHSEALPYDTIWLAVEEASFGSVFRNDTIPFPLADKNGEWLGRRAHALCEVSDTLRTFSRLPAGYSLSLAHAMKNENIPGIKNVGVRLIRKTGEEWKHTRTDKDVSSSMH